MRDTFKCRASFFGRFPKINAVKSFLVLGQMDGRMVQQGAVGESSSADLFGWAREKALIFLLLKLV